MLFVMACVAFFFLGTVSTIAVQHFSHRIENKAVVKVIGVAIYKDVNFNVSVTEIDWGILEPGESKNFSAYIVNKSNVPLALTMTTLDWQPNNASKFATFTWTYDGREIPVNGYTAVTFALTVSEAISGIDGFSFTIIIVGSG